jgi:FxsC-like protein
MPYYFFFSYAHANEDSYVKQFFDELSQQIRDQVGLKADETVGFFDRPALELGAEWTEELDQALQDCPVMVSLYSPAYFNSEYCGKEWEVFRRRRELHTTRARAAGEQNAKHPPVIKPVIWIPLRPDQSVPEAAGGAQYFMGSPNADHNKEGLRKMRKQYATYETNYDLFVENLKNEILDAQNVGLPALPDFQGVNTIDSAFHPGAHAPAKPSRPLAAGGRKGPTFVRFVFIAGQPNQFPAGFRTRDYLQSGGAEWKPYYPDKPRPIELVAQEVAVNLDLFNSELPFDGNLAQAVRDAETDRSLVVLFVDSWSTELDFYKPTLKNLDGYAYMNCSIFVPWNENDPQTAGKTEELRQSVRRNIFPRWSRLADSNQPFFFRDSIHSLDELREQLRDTLRQLQISVGKEGIERATKESIPRRIDSDMTKPSLSHRPSPEGPVT